MDGGSPLDVLAGVDALVEQSLLRAEAAQGEARFAYLETIREYGLRQLDDSGEAPRLRRLHAKYFLQRAEVAEPQLRGAAQKNWPQQLALDHDNLRAAIGALRDSPGEDSEL